jgi:hypothetical protein
MAAWILVPCLVSLRTEFSLLAPLRDKASDGSIADAAHVAGGTSDHIGDESTAAMRGRDADSVNEVHAIDVDSDLRVAGWSMPRAVQVIVTRHRRGLDDRLQNVIWNRRVWSRSWGWTAREYTGSNPHDHHAHFSARYSSAQERDVRPWGLLAAAAATEEDLPVDPKIFNQLLLNALSDPAIAARYEQLAGRGVHNQQLFRTGETIGQDLQSDDAAIATRFDAIDRTLAQVTEALAGLQQK